MSPGLIDVSFLCVNHSQDTSRLIGCCRQVGVVSEQPVQIGMNWKLTTFDRLNPMILSSKFISEYVVSLNQASTPNSCFILL